MFRFFGEDGAQNEAESFSTPLWKPDNWCQNCFDCNVEFSYWKRRHHCRACGNIFCNECSSNRVPPTWIMHSGTHNESKSRVCQFCYRKLRSAADSEGLACIAESPPGTLNVVGDSNRSSKSDSRIVTAGVAESSKDRDGITGTGTAAGRSRESDCRIAGGKGNNASQEQEKVGKATEVSNHSPWQTPRSLSYSPAYEATHTQSHHKPLNNSSQPTTTQQECNSPAGDIDNRSEKSRVTERHKHEWALLKQTFTRHFVASVYHCAQAVPSSSPHSVGDPHAVPEHFSHAHHHARGGVHVHALPDNVIQKLCQLAYRAVSTLSPPCSPEEKKLVFERAGTMGEELVDMNDIMTLLKIKKLNLNSYHNHNQRLPHQQQTLGPGPAGLQRPHNTDGSNSVQFESRYVEGVVFADHVTHRKMKMNLTDCRVLLLSGPLDFEKERRLVSLDVLRTQEIPYYELIVERIADIRNPPVKVMLCGSFVARVAQDELRKRGISLIQHVPGKILEQVSRVTGVQIFPNLDVKELSQYYRFYLRPKARNGLHRGNYNTAGMRRNDTNNNEGNNKMSGGGLPTGGSRGEARSTGGCCDVIGANSSNTFASVYSPGGLANSTAEYSERAEKREAASIRGRGGETRGGEAIDQQQVNASAALSGDEGGGMARSFSVEVNGDQTFVVIKGSAPQYGGTICLASPDAAMLSEAKRVLRWAVRMAYVLQLSAEFLFEHWCSPKTQHTEEERTSTINKGVIGGDTDKRALCLTSPSEYLNIGADDLGALFKNQKEGKVPFSWETQRLEVYSYLIEEDEFSTTECKTQVFDCLISSATALKEKATSEKSDERKLSEKMNYGKGLRIPANRSPRIDVFKAKNQAGNFPHHQGASAASANPDFHSPFVSTSTSSRVHSPPFESRQKSKDVQLMSLREWLFSEVFDRAQHFLDPQLAAKQAEKEKNQSREEAAAAASYTQPNSTYTSYTQGGAAGGGSGVGSSAGSYYHRPALGHTLCYQHLHSRVLITVHIDKQPVLRCQKTRWGSLVGKHGSEPYSTHVRCWHRCKVCKAQVLCTLVSGSTGRLPFGKFLEFFFYNTNSFVLSPLAAAAAGTTTSASASASTHQQQKGCEHAVFRNHQIFFQSLRSDRSLSVSFEWKPVVIHTLTHPQKPQWLSTSPLQASAHLSHLLGFLGYATRNALLWAVIREHRARWHQVARNLAHGLPLATKEYEHLLNHTCGAYHRACVVAAGSAESAVHTHPVAAEESAVTPRIPESAEQQQQQQQNGGDGGGTGGGDGGGGAGGGGDGGSTSKVSGLPSHSSSAVFLPPRRGSHPALTMMGSPFPLDSGERRTTNDGSLGDTSSPGLEESDPSLVHRASSGAPAGPPSNPGPPSKTTSFPFSRLAYSTISSTPVPKEGSGPLVQQQHTLDARRSEQQSPSCEKERGFASYTHKRQLSAPVRQFFEKRRESSRPWSKWTLETRDLTSFVASSSAPADLTSITTNDVPATAQHFSNELLGPGARRKISFRKSGQRRWDHRCRSVPSRWNGSLDPCYREWNPDPYSTPSSGSTNPASVGARPVHTSNPGLGSPHYTGYQRNVSSTLFQHPGDVLQGGHAASHQLRPSALSCAASMLTGVMDHSQAESRIKMVVGGEYTASPSSEGILPDALPHGGELPHQQQQSHAHPHAAAGTSSLDEEDWGAVIAHTLTLRVTHEKMQEYWCQNSRTGFCPLASPKMVNSSSSHTHLPARLHTGGVVPGSSGGGHTAIINWRRKEDLLPLHEEEREKTTMMLPHCMSEGEHACLSWPVTGGSAQEETHAHAAHDHRWVEEPGDGELLHIDPPPGVQEDQLKYCTGVDELNTGACGEYKLRCKRGMHELLSGNADGTNKKGGMHSNHDLKVEWTSPATATTTATKTSGSGTRFEVTLHYCGHFHLLRHWLTLGDVEFAKSLQKTESLVTTGGKSGLQFCITADKRFLLKEVNKVEYKWFNDKGESLFWCYYQTLFANLPSMLTQVYGMYQVIVHGSSEKKIRRFMVLRNLKYHIECGLPAPLFGTDKKLTHAHGKNEKFLVFDLKGSKKNRRVGLMSVEEEMTNNNNDENHPERRNVKGEDLSFSKCVKTNEAVVVVPRPSPKTLWDQDFREWTQGLPLVLSEKDMGYFKKALWNDTYILSILNVMDYSLLVILSCGGGGSSSKDDNKQTLTSASSSSSSDSPLMSMGLIDYFRLYTIDKKVETVAKSVYYYPHDPTVIEPNGYAQRFRGALGTFFVSEKPGRERED